MPKAATEAKTSEAAFLTLNDSSNPELVKKWAADEVAAQAGRNDNPGTMDIFDMKVDRGDSHKCLISGKQFKILIQGQREPMLNDSCVLGRIILMAARALRLSLH